jgi:NAD(P)-dependent dehydrogenase (short-subunit alcohol dehydrogenase family)
MGALGGRVAIVTGAGRGLGAAHARLLAAEGAAVVVNDVGGGVDGSGEDAGPARAVVEEIVAKGGRAVASTEDVTSFEGARRLVGQAIEAFGSLHVLVNNAGILRDRMLVNLSEEDFDAVVAVHLKGHVGTLRAAAAYWREQAKATGAPVRASVVNTSSGAGLLGNVGQTNYAAAKAGIAIVTVVAAKELARYGVRVNAIAPMARTRMTEQTPGLSEMMAPPAEPGRFDPWDPANVSPLVAYLATADCPVTGGVFHVTGGQIGLWQGWRLSGLVDRGRRLEVAEAGAAVAELLERAGRGGEGALASEGMSEAEFGAMLAGGGAGS